MKMYVRIRFARGVAKRSEVRGVCNPLRELVTVAFGRIQSRNYLEQISWAAATPERARARWRIDNCFLAPEISSDRRVFPWIIGFFTHA